MKPVFKCDYCAKMGTEEEIREHEPNCSENYDRRSCYTCVHKRIKCDKDKNWYFDCEAEKEIPRGSIIEFCPKYEFKKKSDSPLENLFGDIFGGFCKK